MGLEARRLLFVGTLGCAAAAGLWFIYLSVPVLAWVAGDFRVFWIAGQLPTGVIYDPAKISAALAPLGETGLRAFVSPPSFLLAITPFAALPLPAAYALWTAAGVMLFCAASWRAAGKSSILLLLVAPAFHWAVIAGQVTLIVGGLIYLAAVSLSRRPIAAGLLFAAAALLKPQAALLIPVALIAGSHWRAMSAAMAGGAAVGLLSLLLHGPELWFAWLSALGEFMDLIRKNGFIMNGITPAAFAHSVGFEGIGAMALMAGGTLLGIGCCWSVFKRTEDAAVRASAIICGGLLCTPYALPYEAASLLPAAAALLTNSKWRAASLAAAAIAVMFPFSPLTPALFAAALLWAPRPPA